MGREKLDALALARQDAFRVYDAQCRECIRGIWRAEFQGYAVAYPMAQGKQYVMEDHFLKSLLEGIRRAGMLLHSAPHSHDGLTCERAIMRDLGAYRTAFLEWEAASAEFHGLTPDGSIAR